MSLSIACQWFQERCRHCSLPYPAVRGPVYENDEGIGLYLAGLHGCASGSTVVMTIAFLADGAPEAYTVQAWSSGDENQMVFLDSHASPWEGDAYLGRLLTVEECRASTRRDAVFEVAGLICGTIPEVVEFLDQTA